MPVTDPRGHVADEDAARDLATLRETAREAGTLALDYLRRGDLERWDKAPGHPVSEADLAVNTLIARRLGAARPDYGWLSEETVDDRRHRAQPRIWLVDPIDGTRAYLRGDPNWCVGLAVIEAGKAVAGVVYAPALDLLFEARNGHGAYCNGTPMRVSGAETVSGCRIIASESMLEHKAWPEPWPEMQVARPKPNATLLRLALVASGAWDATVVMWRKSDWDIAAGALLVHEAGGRATTHVGETFVYNRPVPAQRSVIASGKAMHPLLLRRASGIRLPDPNEGPARSA